MGEAYSRLAEPLQDFHASSKAFQTKGKASVTRGTSWMARLAGWVIGFPQEGENIDVVVHVDFNGQGEIWTGNFAGKKFQSKQRVGQGRHEGLVIESFGPLNFAMAVTERSGHLGLKLRGWDLFGLPIPRFAMPISRACEHGADGRFNFDVEIGLPLFGCNVRYWGWLTPVQAA